MKALLAQTWFKLGLIGLVGLIAVGGFFGFRALTETPAPTATDGKAVVKALPSSPAIEEKWGIRVSQIGVSADGGMVDFRFVVLDPEKALAMMKDEKNLPVLVPEGSKNIVNSAAMMPSKHALNAGQTYFLLYRNTQNAIKHNSTISVVFGNLRLDKALVL